MRALALLMTCLLPSAALAQPPPEGVLGTPLIQHDARPHLYGELLGATFFGVSLNLEQAVGETLALRGGIGVLPELFGEGVNLTVIGGLLYVPGEGAYRPELGLTATVVALLDRSLLGGPYLGVRYHAANGSVIRFGAHVFVFRDGATWGLAPWPAVSFGGRL